MNHTGFWWILLAGIIYGLLHSVLASLTVKKFAERLFGHSGKTYYRFFYVIAAIITTPIYIGLIVLLPDARIYSIPAPWVFVTILLEIAAIGCLCVSLWQIGALSFLGLDPFIRPDKPSGISVLNTSGFYKWVRHPIYFFSFVILWLTPLMTWNLFSFAIGVTVYTLIGSLFEERKLVIEFGQAYLDYRKKTPWIIPIRLK